MATPGERHLLMRQEERIRDEAGHKAGWTFLWTLFAFKIATVGIIWFAASSSRSHEMSFIIATTWYWLAIPILAISGPLLYRWRLLQQRRRREALRGAEWMDRHQGDDPPLKVADIIWEHDHRRA
jgi:small-conductance mechanosensitive channel